MKNNTLPTDAEMPAKIAELMYPFGTPCGALLREAFIKANPMKSRDGSRLAVDRCAELGLMEDYADYLHCEVDIPSQKPLIERMMLPTPAQETSAAWRTLKEATK